MTAQRCPRLWQAEAIADGRLSHPEVAAFERHAGSCAECAREASELSRLRELTALLPALQASELERRRQRNELLSKANAAMVNAERPRARFAAMVIAGAILVTGASAFGLHAAWHALTTRDEPIVAPPSPSSATRARPPARAAAPPPDHEAPEAPAVEEAAPITPAPAAIPRVRSKRAASAPPPRAEAEVPTAGLAFAEAMAAFSAGDYGRAQRLFTAFERQHHDDDRVEDALFLRAVAHARRGDHAASRAAASEYLKRYPNGLRAREAERLAR